MNVDYEKRDLVGSAAQLVVTLTFAPFALTAFLAFFYIGYRAKNKKWLKYGLIILLF